MKKSIITVFAASAFLITACGDDSSSNAGSTISATASLVVDETNKILVMTPDKYYADQCVVENESPVWKSVLQAPSSDTFRYEFHGDSLYLYEIDGDEEYSANIYVGGSAGNLYGTWKYTACRYNDEDGLYCSDKKRQYYDMEYRFSPGKVSASAVYHYDRYLAELNAQHYMDSYFMYQLYNKLTGRGYDNVYINEITYSEPEEVQEVAERNGVQVIERSKNGGKFVIGEKTFTLTVNKVDEKLIIKEPELYEQEEIDLVVSDGVTSCHGYYLRTRPEKSHCNMEYADYLKFEQETDGNGNEYMYAYRLRKDNESEFNECLRGISVVSQDMNVLYKKAAKSRSNVEKDIDRTIRKMLKYAEN